MSAAGPKRKTGSSGAFGAMLGDSATVSRPSGAGAAAQIAGVDALFALQSVDGDEPRRRQQIDRSNALLDELERLKADLLGGRVDASRLGRIRDLVARHQHVDDPALADLIAQVDLRAQVEMAKLGR